MAAHSHPDGGFHSLPTRYNGVLYRSRLEAKLAVMFDTLSARFEFEAEGYTTPYGWYLPDFWLADAYADGQRGVLIEAKPEGWDEPQTVSYVERTAFDDDGLLVETVWQTNTEARLQYTALQLGVGALLVRGIDSHQSEWMLVAPKWDAPVHPSSCASCGALAFGTHVTRCPKCGRADAPGSQVRIAQALHAARTYRFW